MSSQPRWIDPALMKKLSWDREVSITHLSQSAYEYLHTQGITDAAISILLHLVEKHAQLYGHTITKSQQFCPMIYHPGTNQIRWTTNINARWLKQGIGGDCMSLNLSCYDQIRKQLQTQLWEESTDSLSLTLAQGTARTHFLLYPDYVHRFMLLELGSTSVLIDASLGEISLLSESGYVVMQSLPYTQDYLDTDSRVSSIVGRLDTQAPAGAQVSSPGQMITLGISSDRTYVINYSFVRDVHSELIVPVLTSLDPQGRTIYSYLHVDPQEIVHLYQPEATLSRSTQRELTTILNHLATVPISYADWAPPGQMSDLSDG